MRWKVSFDQ